MQQRASDLMDQGLALRTALLQAQHETPPAASERTSTMITIAWQPNSVRLTQTELPDRYVEIAEAELAAVLAQIIAEAAGEPERFWDILA
ncbi:MAG: hypothetical protein H7Z42_10265 [Roseiflexaceae bacterium]|nr:hypothetical protein [Roseiflexaceae bacterium]